MHWRDLIKARRAVTRRYQCGNTAIAQIRLKCHNGYQSNDMHASEATRGTSRSSGR